jgi:hypothetical protein
MEPTPQIKVKLERAKRFKCAGLCLPTPGQSQCLVAKPGQGYKVNAT